MASRDHTYFIVLLILSLNDVFISNQASASKYAILPDSPSYRGPPLNNPSFTGVNTEVETIKPAQRLRGAPRSYVKEVNSLSLQTESPNIAPAGLLVQSQVNLNPSPNIPNTNIQAPYIPASVRNTYDLDPIIENYPEESYQPNYGPDLILADRSSLPYDPLLNRIPPRSKSEAFYYDKFESYQPSEPYQRPRAHNQPPSPQCYQCSQPRQTQCSQASPPQCSQCTQTQFCQPSQNQCLKPQPCYEPLPQFYQPPLTEYYQPLPRYETAPPQYYQSPISTYSQPPQTQCCQTSQYYQPPNTVSILYDTPIYSAEPIYCSSLLPQTVTITEYPDYRDSVPDFYASAMSSQLQKVYVADSVPETVFLSYQEQLPLNLQVFMPPPSPAQPIMYISSPTSSFETQEYISGPTFAPSCTSQDPPEVPPIIIMEESGSKLKNLLPILLVAMSNNGRNNCGCNCGCNCSGSSFVPIPYPIPIPTNCPIIIGGKCGGSSGSSSSDSTSSGSSGSDSASCECECEASATS